MLYSIACAVVFVVTSPAVIAGFVFQCLNAALLHARVCGRVCRLLGGAERLIDAEMWFGSPARCGAFFFVQIHSAKTICSQFEPRGYACVRMHSSGFADALASPRQEPRLVRGGILVCPTLFFGAPAILYLRQPSPSRRQPIHSLSAYAI